MRKFFFFILFASLSLTAFAQQKIALLEPRVGEGSTPVSGMEKRMVQGELRKAIVNFSGFEAFTRSDIDQMMQEQNFQRTGMVSAAQIKKLGEMSGADYICVSTLTKSNEEFYLEAYLIHLESGRMSNPASQYGELSNGKLANMFPACKALAEELLNGTSSISSSSSDAFELYEKGLKYYEAQEYTEAIRCFIKAAEQGVPEAQYALGVYYENGQVVQQNHLEAYKYFVRAAEQGYSDAQYALGLYYESGKAVQKNYNEAVKWYRKAAENGNDGAQLFLAQCLAEGKGTQKNVREAIQWYEKSAEQGNVDAQRLLGGIYANGEEVNQDFESAVYWFRKAAEQGNAEAQRLLGICYEEGYGVSQDYKTAVYWYQKAAENGSDKAREALNRL